MQATASKSEDGTEDKATVRRRGGGVRRRGGGCEDRTTAPENRAAMPESGAAIAFYIFFKKFFHPAQKAR